MFNFQTMNNMINLMNQFKNNPAQLLSQRFKFPSEMTNPEDIIRHLLDTNQVTQAQVDSIKQFQDNPMFRKLMNM